VKRGLLAVAAALFVGANALVIPSAHAQDVAVPDVFEARAEAGGEHDSIAVPAYFETFFPYSLSEASNGSSHGYHAVFYAGFFLTAAAEQYGFGPPPGTTETLYPQGPTQGSNAVVPVQQAAFGSSNGVSSASGTSGQATAGGGDLPGIGHVGFGEVSTSVDAVADKVTSTAHVVMHDLTLAGTITIGSITGDATAVATGASGGAVTTGGLSLADVRVLGVPLDLFSGAIPGIPGVQDILTAAGVSITRQPDVRETSPDGTDAHLHLGGVTFTFTRPEREFTLEVTFGRLDVAARALRASPAPSVVRGALDDVEDLTSNVAIGASTLNPAPDLSAIPIGGVTAVRRTSVRGADFSVLSAVIALAAIAALFSRRVLHALVHQ